MTIYTPSQADKKPGKDLVEPEVVTEPLTGERKDAEAVAANVENDTRIIYLRAKRRRAFMHMLLAIIILVVLALGAITSVVLYRHLSKKVYSGRCGNVFYDTSYHDSLQAPEPAADETVPMECVVEDFVVSPGEDYEELHTPQFDEVRETFVLHDFTVNYTAFIDHERELCFIIALKTSIVRPQQFVTQIEEFSDGGVKLQTLVLHESFGMIPVTLFEIYGRRIYDKCSSYGVLFAESYAISIEKRSVSGPSQRQNLGKLLGTYAMLTNNATHQQLYKIKFYELSHLGKV
ncbi:integral membrane protein 2b-like [Plakobranchus ocellatus]|uniref:Integral membrane protein 2 n=1 Tax=Plakobranchus ocellatus TaxID=259542 RepID=A0AAV3Y8V5_9GAST|nr:integral membrane protein 2b-like [Plakobranchus ocellatus]